MSMHDPDLMRLIELERADAERIALEDGAKQIEIISQSYRSELYRKALKVASKTLREMIGKR